MNSLHLLWNLNALIPSFFSQLFASRKTKIMHVPYRSYFLPEVLRQNKKGEKIIISETFLQREKINLSFFHIVNSVAPGEQ